MLTPFVRPRTLARFLWTCLLPVVPLTTCWDGIVSLLRVCSRAELRALRAPITAGGYAWEAGRASTGMPPFAFTYLLGYPVSEEHTGAAILARRAHAGAPVWRTDECREVEVVKHVGQPWAHTLCSVHHP